MPEFLKKHVWSRLICLSFFPLFLNPHIERELYLLADASPKWQEQEWLPLRLHAEWECLCKNSRKKIQIPAANVCPRAVSLYRTQTRLCLLLRGLQHCDLFFKNCFQSYVFLWYIFTLLSHFLEISGVFFLHHYDKEKLIGCFAAL